MGHKWDRGGERCLKCGDKDWFAGPECSADAPQQTDRMKATPVKWATPVTHGSSRFEVMTDELHARPVAVVNTLEDARLVSASPELFEALIPFVALLQPHNDRNYSGSDSTPIFAINDAQITLGDLRKARAAIAKATA